MSVFQHRIAFNCIPHIDVFLDDDSTKEEWKMVVETKKIMGDQGIKVAATCVRVPVLRCHAESVNVEFAGDVSVEAARAALAATDGITVMDDCATNTYPMPGLLAGTDDTYVGRLRARRHGGARSGPVGGRRPDPQGRGAQCRPDCAALGSDGLGVPSARRPAELAGAAAEGSA